MIKNIFLIIEIIYIIYIVFKAIKKKEMKGLIFLLLLLPFNIFWWSSVILGGSAFHHAELKYELYQVGHYYLFSHGVYTEVGKEQYIYMQIIEVIASVCFGICFVIALIDYIGNKGTNYSAETTKDPLQFGESTKKYKRNRRFISCSSFGILRFVIWIVFFIVFAIIIFSNFEVMYLMFIPVMIYLFIGGIYNNFSTCVFKKDKLIVRSDNPFKAHQAQKRCVINYADIKDIDIINIRFKNTQGEDILLNVRNMPLRNRRGIMREKPSYYAQYKSLDLEVIHIHLKNSSHPEGIVLNLYTHQQKEFMFNELKRRIQATNL